MKLEKLSPGDVVYSLSKHKMGNTMVRTTSLYRVTIKSIDLESQTCIASLNGNPYRKFYSHEWSKWRKNKPVMIRTSIGASRVATKADIAALKQEAE